MSTHNLHFEQKYENIRIFLSESFHVLMVKFSVYLNRCVLRNVLHGNIRCWYSLEALRRRASNEYPKYMFL